MMDRLWPKLLLTVAWAMSGVALAHADEVRNSVVKVFATRSMPDMFRPWEVRPPQEGTGSGVVIAGGRILTNAHVVQYGRTIYVQPNGSSEKHSARIEFISEVCDLATLLLEEPDEIAELTPIPLAAGLPPIQTKVQVLGYPTGGDTLSVTEGIFSRVEVAPYGGDRALLRMQVDAAINPGNSGGPAIVNAEIVGIAFSHLSGGDNIGYLIPAEIVRHFLDDCTADGRFDGFPLLDLNGATLENPALRRYLNIEREVTGVLIHRVNGATWEGLLQPWDIIHQCDGITIDNLGMVPLEQGVRVHWVHLVARRPAGSTVRLTVIRAGERLEFDVPTQTRREAMIQPMKGERPSYLVYGGLVFSPVTTNLLMQAGSRWGAFMGMRGRLLTRYITAQRSAPDEEIVVACGPILPHTLMKGYELTPLSVLTHVNDVPVRSLRHLAGMLHDHSAPFIIFRFENEEEEKIVLDPALVAQHQAEILRNNNIPWACSEDLRELCPTR